MERARERWIEREIERERMPLNSMKQQMAAISHSTTTTSSDEVSLTAKTEKAHIHLSIPNGPAQTINSPLNFTTTTSSTSLPTPATTTHLPNYNGPIVPNPSPLPLKDRVAIITGGSGGIGSAVSLHLAVLGARIVISYLGDPTPADALLLSINSLHPSLSSPRAIKVETDVTDEAQVTNLFDRAQQAFGPNIHIVVTSAGVQDPTYPTIINTSLAEWEKVFDVNAKGTFLCCREAGRRLVRGGGGRIVTMSSSTVGSIREGYGAYSATKGAVEVMTRVMAKEMRGMGITANAVAPGPVVTAMFYGGKTEEMVRAARELSPMGRLGEPRDVAPVVGFLVSDEGEWVNGQVIRINGGYV